ncbi:MAG TPA: secretin and TonB N-terminal domain-containing protein [Candidatus Limnocylindrales bacterium]|nr:secretin and TonB N-terminal domain-containing protein [Candidatus Limnocylindrales bacterium]
MSDYPARYVSFILTGLVVLVVLNGCARSKGAIKSFEVVAQQKAAKSVKIRSPVENELPTLKTRPSESNPAQGEPLGLTLPAKVLTSGDKPSEKTDIEMIQSAPVPSIRIPQTGEEAKYRGQPITLDFKDADIRDVFRAIAEINNLNLVLHPEVRGRVTVRLINVPWDQALDVILKLHGLAVEIERNILRIASHATFQREIEAKRLEQKQRLLAIETQKKLEPLRTETIPLNFADPHQMATIIEGVLAGRRGVK